MIDSGAKVDAKMDGSGKTPLYKAAIRNNLKMAQLLIDNGADKNVKDNDGEKPIDKAKSFEMFQLLGGRDQSGKPVLELSKFLK